MSVDGEEPSRFSAYSPELTAAVIQYSRALSPGSHTIIFTSEATSRFGMTSLFYRPISRVVATSVSTVNMSTSSEKPKTSSAMSATSSESLSLDISSASHMSSVVTPSIATSSPFVPASTSQILSPRLGGVVSPTLIAGVALGGAACIIAVVLFVIFKMIQRRRRGNPAMESAGRSELRPVSPAHVDASPMDSGAADRVADTVDPIRPWAYDGDSQVLYSDLDGLPEYSERDWNSRGLSYAHGSIIPADPLKSRSRN